MPVSLSRRTAARPARLVDIVAQLHAHYGAPDRPPVSDLFGLYLWDRVGYLRADDQRRAAFTALARTVGLTPQRILAARPATLVAIARIGGIEPEKRAAHMRTAAELVIGDFDGDLDSVKGLEVADARRALRKLPMTAESGADRLLVLARTHPVLALESNGLRLLQRIGYGDAHKDYNRSYRSTVEAAAPQMPNDVDWSIVAHLLLRRHGQDMCKTRAPQCEGCVVRSSCAYFKHIHAAT